MAPAAVVRAGQASVVAREEQMTQLVEAVARHERA